MQIESLKIPLNALDALNSLRKLLEKDFNHNYRYGIGFKRISGEFIEDELVIVVYVPKKKPQDKIPLSLRVPMKYEGFHTDVVESQNTLISDSSSYNPLRGGIQISPPPLPGFPGEFGTLGCIVRKRSGGGRLFLTCEHVVSNTDPITKLELHNTQNQIMFQPASNTPNSAIGKCIEASIPVDAAIIEPTSSHGISNTIQEIGYVKGSCPSNLVMIGDKVRKRGRTTGVTTGLVRVVLPAQPATPQSIEIQGVNFNGGFPYPSARFADHGDSGACIVNERQEIVGLLNLITDNTGITALATLIDPIRDALKIEVAVDPVITSITPNSAVITSPVPVVIGGFGFDSPNQVYFGNDSAVIVQESPTQLKVYPPVMLASTTIDVRVKNKWGDISEIVPESKFEYRPLI
ncbi:TPA: IPT/TIG domain-containing protein [Bacillus toyonensis]|nr:IPT/TIG domain-containing protein [Bacillus toyonensis]